MKLLLSILLTVAFLLFTACGETINEDSLSSEIAAMAERKLEDNDPEEALVLFQSALEKDSQNPESVIWNIGRAECYFELGQKDQALSILSQTITTNQVQSSRKLLLIARIEAFSSPVTSLNTLTSISLENLNEYHSDIAIALCRAQLEKIQIATVPSYRQQAWFELFVLLELEKRYAAIGDIAKATLYGAEIDRLFPNAHNTWGKPDYQTEETGSDSWVALLLPLTGEGSEYALQVANGAHLAFNQFEEMHSIAPKLVDFDTQGNQERLLELIQSLSENPSCLAILGPLTSSSTMAAANPAKAANIPLISPTATSSDVDIIGAPVFRLVVSEGNQAAAIAEYAVREAGLSRFAVIYPHTAQATGEAEQFRAIVERMGGTVVASQGYQPGDTDFKEQINSIKYYSPDAIFLPVSAWDAVQIAPQLRFYRLEVPLFGTSGWDDDMLLRHGGEYVEGAVFTAAFGLNSLHPTTARFVYTYNRAFGAEPTTIAAQGFDAAGVLLDAWQSVTNPTRSRIVRKLSSMPPYYGATGRCVLGSDTETRSSWPMMTVNDGEIIGID